MNTTRALWIALITTCSLACAVADPLENVSSSSAGQGGGASAQGSSVAQGVGGSGDGGASSVTVGSGGAGGDGGAPCVGEDDATLCTNAAAECDAIDVVDSCGISRQPNCGSCAAPETCGGAGSPHQCGCTPKTPTQLCTQSNQSCGPLATDDGCGQSLSIDCGSCSGYLSCMSGQCGCSAPPDPTSLTCVDAGGPKLNLYAPTGEIALAYVNSGNTIPATCTSQNSIILQVSSAGVSLPWPINTNSCGTYRVCSWDPVCGSAYSPGKVFNICLNSVGAPTCNFM